MKELKAVIFDLDGTLLNTLEDLTDSMNHVLKEFGYRGRTLTEIRHFVGNGIRKLVERASGAQGERLDEMFKTMSEYYGIHCKEKTAPYEGILDLLDQLKEEGFKLAIVSNKLDPAVKELTELYFGSRISVAIGEREGVSRKPSPDTVFAAIKELGVVAQECIYVGDSDVDVETAARAGVPCISVLWGFRDRKNLEDANATTYAATPKELFAKLRTRKRFRERFMEHRYRYLLFDLDGTLTNPEEGITKSVQYSLQDFGIQADRKDLLCFIGPPLWDSYMDFFGFTKEQADRAVLKYRERYNEIGVYENFAYEGIKELLASLKKQGYHLGVATSKPEPMAKKVLTKYELEEYFEVITGSEFSGERSKKSEVIEEALHRFGLSMSEKESVLMIGDRKHDVNGAKEIGVDCLGVYYGFAQPGELEEAGADYVADTVTEVGELLGG